MKVYETEGRVGPVGFECEKCGSDEYLIDYEMELIECAECGCDYDLVVKEAK